MKCNVWSRVSSLMLNLSEAFFLIDSSTKDILNAPTNAAPAINLQPMFSIKVPHVHRRYCCVARSHVTCALLCGRPPQPPPARPHCGAASCVLPGFLSAPWPVKRLRCQQTTAAKGPCTRSSCWSRLPPAQWFLFGHSPPPLLSIATLQVCAHEVSLSLIL
jgi:hypothetical protein